MSKLFEILSQSSKNKSRIIRNKKETRLSRNTLVKFPFVIIYEIIGTEIIIYSVFHTSRNPENKP
ncbi:hypothetical protein [Flavobacterium panacis]|uniref:hypothetical protein n=1 Tax=Flavobacterium TaxID=237 RepID=UPI00338E4983